MPCEQMVTNPTVAALAVRPPSQTMSSRYKSFYFNSKSIQYPSKVDSMQTEVMHYSIQNLKLPEIIKEFLRLELTSDAGRFVPL